MIFPYNIYSSPNSCEKGEAAMSGGGKKDKGKKENRKKPAHNLKEKRKLKQDKKQHSSVVPT